MRLPVSLSGFYLNMFNHYKNGVKQRVQNNEGNEDFFQHNAGEFIERGK